MKTLPIQEQSSNYRPYGNAGVTRFYASLSTVFIMLDSIEVSSASVALLNGPKHAVKKVFANYKSRCWSEYPRMRGGMELQRVL